jgi:hypothetical protein
MRGNKSALWDCNYETKRYVQVGLSTVLVLARVESFFADRLAECLRNIRILPPSTSRHTNGLKVNTHS